MRKYILLLLLSVLPLAASAQAGLFKFGYFSYSKAFAAMPGYSVAQRDLANLKSQYDAEAKRAQDEFNRQYEDFLEGEKTFAPSILKKRQAELKELMDKNVAFRVEADRLLEQATTNAYAPIKAKLNGVLRRIGADRGYAFIINIDDDDVPYVDASIGEDITPFILAAIK